MAEKTEVTVQLLNTMNIKHVETDIKISFKEIDFSIDTVEEFEKNYKNWFKAEFNRSLHQAADVLEQMCPNREAGKDVLLDATRQIMEHKVTFLEDYTKKQGCKFFQKYIKNGAKNR